MAKRRLIKCCCRTCQILRVQKFYGKYMLSASEEAVGVRVADVWSWSVSLLQMDPNNFEYIVQLRVRASSHLSPQSLSLFCYHMEDLVALRQHFIGYWRSRFALSRHASPNGCLAFGFILQR